MSAGKRRGGNIHLGQLLFELGLIQKQAAAAARRASMKGGARLPGALQKRGAQLRKQGMNQAHQVHKVQGSSITYHHQSRRRNLHNRSKEKIGTGEVGTGREQLEAGTRPGSYREEGEHCSRLPILEMLWLCC